MDVVIFVPIVIDRFTIFISAKFEITTITITFQIIPNNY